MGIIIGAVIGLLFMLLYTLIKSKKHMQQTKSINDALNKIKNYSIDKSEEQFLIDEYNIDVSRHRIKILHGILNLKIFNNGLEFTYSANPESNVYVHFSQLQEVHLDVKFLSISQGVQHYFSIIYALDCIPSLKGGYVLRLAMEDLLVLNNAYQQIKGEKNKIWLSALFAQTILNYSKSKEE